MLQNLKVPDFRDVSVTPHRHSSSVDILSSVVQESKNHLLFIVSQTGFNKNNFLLLLNNGFSLFFELLDNLATHITWPSEEDPAELCQSRSVDLSNTT